jgi:hypothetical protein
MAGKLYLLAWWTSLIGQPPEELILSGTYMCGFGFEKNTQFLILMTWMLNTVWEVLALCLLIWVAMKHFRNLRRLGPSTGSTMGGCFRVLIKSQVLYFARWALVWMWLFFSAEVSRVSALCGFCLQFGYLSKVRRPVAGVCL